MGVAAELYVLLSIGDGLVAQIPSLLLSIATAIIVTRVSSNHDMASHISDQVNLSRAWFPVAGVMFIIGLVPGMPNVMFLLAALAAGAAAWFAMRNERTTSERAAVGDAQNQAEVEEKSPPGTITAKDVTDYSAVSIQIGFGLIPMIEEGDQSPLIGRITSIRKEVSRAMGFVIPGVRIRDDLSMPANAYRIRIGQTIVAEDTLYPDRKLALPGALSKRKLKGIEGKDPSFGMDAIWIQPHQQAEADDHIVVEPDSVLATHLSQMLYQHGYNLLGPDDVQALIDTLEISSPTLVDAVVPKLIPLHTLTSVLRHLLADRIPISDLRRILEGLSEMAGRNLSTQDMAEGLRPSLAALLIQQVAPMNAPLPLITLAPELEQLLMRSRGQNPNDPLILDHSLAQTILSALAKAADDLAAQGRTAIVVVSATLRRPFSAYLRAHSSDTIVLAINELPDKRPIEVVTSLGGQQQLPED